MNRRTVVRDVVVACAVVATLLGGRHVAAPNVAFSQVSSCLSAPVRFAHLTRQCMTNTVERHTKEHGLGAAASALDRSARARREIASACHAMMHFEGRRVGHNASRARLEQVARGIKGGSGQCSAGALHGLLEAHLEDSGLTASDGKFLDALCLRRSPRLQAIACAHGLGHAIALDHKLAIAPSLAVCQSLSVTLRPECSSGILMIQSEGADFRGGSLAKATTPRRVRRYCEAVAEAVVHLCYRWVPLGARIDRNPSQASMGTICRQAREQSEKNYCFVGIGRLGDLSGANDSCKVQRGRAAQTMCSYGREVFRAISFAEAAKTPRRCAKSSTPTIRYACIVARARISALNVDQRSDLKGVCGGLVGIDAKWCADGYSLRHAPLDYSGQEQAVLDKRSPPASSSVA